MSMSSSWLLQKRLSQCAVAHEYALGAVPGTTSAARFASHADAACFSIPSEVIEYESRVEEVDALPSVSEESEGALDAELRALRARISRARALKTASERECVKLDKELKSHAEVVGRIQAIASAVGKENATVKEGLAATGTMVHSAKQPARGPCRGDGV